MDNETKTAAPMAHDPVEPATSASSPVGAPASLSHGRGQTVPEDGGSRTQLGLPVAEPFKGLTSPLPREKTGVFSQLVTDDGDIAGLVAYSIYKQNKLDWLAAFEAAKGRNPSEEELASYIIGEGTPRRIATYRHLAEATLSGNGPGAAGSTAGPRVGRRVGPLLGDNAAMIATYAAIALVVLIGLLIAAHFTMSSR